MRFAAGKVAGGDAKRNTLASSGLLRWVPVFPDGQVLMNTSARMLRLGWAALLSLVFAVTWLPVSHGSASPSDHAALAGTPGHLAHSERNDLLGPLTIKADADCDISAKGCCMTAHCCPGISVGLHDLPAFVSDDSPTSAPAVHGTGSDPAIVLPPPRSLPV